MGSNIIEKLNRVIREVNSLGLAGVVKISLPGFAGKQKSELSAHLFANAIPFMEVDGGVFDDALMVRLADGQVIPEIQGTGVPPVPVVNYL